MMQKLLLLPELSDVAIAGTDADPFKIASTAAVSKESHSNDEYELLSNEVAPARILVSGLTASWTHVKNDSGISMKLT